MKGAESGSSLGNTVGNDSVVVQATEGWLELFLTPSEKATFSQWREEIADKSLLHWLTSDFFATAGALYSRYRCSQCRDGGWISLSRTSVVYYQHLWR